MRVFAVYLLIMNITAFAAMGLDKYRAKKKMRRIRERTLFLLALIGGSLGSFLGMRLFRHKTKHRTFVIGIPVILCIQVALFIALHFWFPTRTQSAKTAVRSQLRQIRELDAAAIESFISYENLSEGSGIPVQKDTSTAQDAVLAFFRHFRYRILSCDLAEDKNSAVVRAQITNIDAAPLAHDLALELTRRRILDWDNASDDTLTEQDFFLLLDSALKENTYELSDTRADFHLAWEDRHWEIRVDDRLQDELMGGFISRMKDPNLVPAEEVLPVYMDKFKAMDADLWLRFLGKEDIFSTYSPTYADELDHLYMEKISEYFDWSLDSMQTDKDTAAALLTITTVDMPLVMEHYRSSLLDYAATTESITSTDAELADETASRLLDAIRTYAQPGRFSIEVTMENNGTGWQLQFDEALSDTIMGSMNEALKVLGAAQEGQ